MLFSAPRTRRIAVINHKGGTGKTTTAVHMAAGFADAGRRVLLVDFDPQGNVATWFGVVPEVTAADLLLGRVTPRAATAPGRHNLYCTLSDVRLGPAQEALFGRMANDEVLRRKLSPLEGYDCCIVDCAPSLNLLTRNALLYAEEVVIPISMEYLALVGVRQLVESILRLRNGRRADVLHAPQQEVARDHPHAEGTLRRGADRAHPPERQALGGAEPRTDRLRIRPLLVRSPRLPQARPAAPECLRPRRGPPTARSDGIRWRAWDNSPDC